MLNAGCTFVSCLCHLILCWISVLCCFNFGLGFVDCYSFSKSMEFMNCLNLSICSLGHFSALANLLLLLCMLLVIVTLVIALIILNLSIRWRFFSFTSCRSTLTIGNPLEPIRKSRNLGRSNGNVDHNPLFFHGAAAPSGPGPTHYRGFTIILRHTNHTR